MQGMLEGVRVLDLSRLLPGPFCTAWLAGQGALVDKVEPPGVGDTTRHMPPYQDGVGVYFRAVNGGKRSLAVNLRSEEGRALIRRLVPSYDVLVEGFKPGVLEAMGLAPETLHALHPGLIIARLSGFGQTGPWSSRPGHDLNYVGLGGSVAPAARVGEDALALPVVQIADTGGGMVAAAGVAAALFQRTRTGRGAVLDVSLAEAAMWMGGIHVAAGGADGDPPQGQAPLSGGLPIYGCYECADGKWVTVGALEPKFQQALVAGTGAELDRASLAAAFRTKPRDQWVEELAGACVGPALGPSEVGDFAHHVARGAVARVGGATVVRAPLGRIPDAPAPEGIGDDTDTVLAEAGVSAEELAALRSVGAVG